MHGHLLVPLCCAVKGCSTVGVHSQTLVEQSSSACLWLTALVAWAAVTQTLNVYWHWLDCNSKFSTNFLPAESSLRQLIHCCRFVSPILPQVPFMCCIIGYIVYMVLLQQVYTCLSNSHRKCLQRLGNTWLYIKLMPKGILFVFSVVSKAWLCRPNLTCLPQLVSCFFSVTTKECLFCV